MALSEPCTQVADGIYQVRLPLPFALNIINTYLLQGQDGWTVVDTGLNYPPAQEAWAAAFAALGMTPAAVEQIIVTHHHPDHYGMAGWFQQQAGRDIAVYMSPREAELARLVWDGQGKLSERGFEWYLNRGGMPPEDVAVVARSMDSTAEMTFPHPAQLNILHPGETISIGSRTFNLLHAPGHSDGQLLLYDSADRLILSGDHVLMKITPNIGVWPDSEPDPLGRFLDSLRELRALDVRLALPGHKALITDWRGRIDELLAHHDARLEQVRAAVSGGVTIYQAARKVFDIGTFTAHEWRFAMAETLAHLEYLQHRGLVRPLEDDARLRFEPA